MIYGITHTTTYEYSDPVSLSHHLLRLQPRELAGQQCLEHDIAIQPRPGVTRSHADYFGNQMIFVTVEGAHRQLVATSRSRVRVEAIAPPEPEDTPAWEAVRELCRRETPGEDLEARDFVYDSPLIKEQPEFGAYAAASFTPGVPLLTAVLDLTNRIHKDFKFDPKATTIATPLEQVMKSRRGVCQDFAQLEIAFLRAMGIPARYVSGYLETDPPPGKTRLAGADASHAWVSFFCPGAGWIDVDPTNNLLPSNRHITVAWGRDYSDVSPIRGVILGSGEHTLKVAVDVIPLPEGKFGLL
ncbi:MAG: transglutaminase domain protein [Pedosphaera sp.]|nr:transglutaminase domain protein [Pedosphaera sp.]